MTISNRKRPESCGSEVCGIGRGRIDSIGMRGVGRLSWGHTNARGVDRKVQSDRRVVQLHGRGDGIMNPLVG
jgi:hypothetical protein